MSEHQSEMAFLRYLIAFDNTDESRDLDERIAEGQRNLRCIKRAASLAALFAALGMAGFAYGTLLEDNFPYGRSHFVLRFICEFGLAAAVPLAVLLAFLVASRAKLDRLREECRRRIAIVLELRLDNPRSGLSRISLSTTAPVAVATSTPRDSAESNRSVTGRNASRCEPEAAREAEDFSRFEGEGGRRGPGETACASG
jgi:hypothetical protein